MSQVECPNCKNSIALKGVKPGRFMPTCPKCKKPFVLSVPADPNQRPTAAVAPAKPAAAGGPQSAAPPGAASPAKSAPVSAAKTAAPAADVATGAWQAPAEPHVADRTAALPAAADDATGAWDSPSQDPGATTGADGNLVAGAHDRTEVFTDAESDRTAALPSPSQGTKAGKGDRTRAGAATGGPADDLQVDLPEMLGGYKVVKQLGQGGMGTVLLARQVSLDRDVALKVMNPRWSQDPVFLARFTREAYAAAQLVHHNIVQIYDIGVQDDIHYFSMEFVKGTNLADLVRKDGKLDVDVAAGYILQAARGLKFAHDQGMVHRDIKPDNLMLNDQGVVKVADLGLVKTPGASALEDQPVPDAAKAAEGLSALPHVTAAGVAMGTPAYMAPEQGRNAAQVDHRADIYSLGCTLYVLLTGRPVFQGKTAIEVITKHFNEPIVPPENFAKRVPKEISALLMKMLAKKPEDRYSDLNDVIVDLEKFLGVQSAGAFTPREDDANALEEAVKGYNSAPALTLKKLAVPGFLGACALVALILAAFSKLFAAGVLGMAVMAIVFGFLVSGFTFKTHLYTKLRELILGSSWSDYAVWAVGAILFLVALQLFGILWVLILFAFLAAGCVAAYHILIERRLVEERAEALDKAQKLMRNLRLKGLNEEALMQFVCQYGGDNWEEMFEALFGYDHLLQARTRFSRGESAKQRPKHAAWRDPIIAWIETRQRARKETAEKKMLQQIEQKNLEAKGMSKQEAAAAAEEAAAVMVQAAGDLKKAEEPAAAGEAPRPRAKMKSLLEAAERTYAAPSERKKKPLFTFRDLVNTFFGWKVRFLLGTFLIGCTLFWMYDNGAFV